MLTRNRPLHPAPKRPAAREAAPGGGRFQNRARWCLNWPVLRLLLVGLAGLAGTLCRYWLSGALARRYGEAFPAGTLAVNLLGCFAAGLLFHLMHERAAFSETARAVVFVGLLGGFTTFSSYGLQTFELLRDGRAGVAALNVVASNLLGVLAVFAGYASAKLLGGA